MSSPSLKYLTHLRLENCERCLQLPLLEKPSSLKNLNISKMINIKYIYDECYDGGVVFVALEILSIYSEPNLIRLSREDGENIFPYLYLPWIVACPNFLPEKVLVQGLHSLKTYCGK